MKATHHLALSTSRRATLKKYGIDEVDFVALARLQDNRCAMCRRPFTSARPPCCDHDHTTGLLRGLACHRCNRDILGVLGDNPEFFRAIVAYLESPPATRLDGPRRRAPGAPPQSTGRG